MPIQHVQPQSHVPVPVPITPALLKQHSITAEEYARIEAALKRNPSLTELGIFCRHVVRTLLLQELPRTH